MARLAAWLPSSQILPAYTAGMFLSKALGCDHMFIRRLHIRRPAAEHNYRISICYPPPALKRSMQSLERQTARIKPYRTHKPEPTVLRCSDHNNKGADHGR